MKKANNSKEPTLSFGAPARIFEYARQNRNKPTAAEAVLWEELRTNRIKGLKFRRQHPIGIFIVDFYCHQAKLAIELDGAYHFDADQQEHDQNRTLLLNEARIREIRFTNEEVLTSRLSVVEAIIKVVEGGNEEE